ncbi:MAG: divalent-cation tolerance protein CutA, partial [Xanthobacteraceae bacterium]
AGRRFGMAMGLHGRAARRRADRQGTNQMATDQRAVFVYTTYPSVVEAERAGRALVERRLCACVNILPGMVSLYWWQGAIERGDEAVMIIKTRATLAEAVRAAVKQMHSYTTPAVLVLPIESVDPDYHAWIVAETEEGK